MSAATIDFDLVRKYNVAAPRYTSYPPATHFAEITGNEILERVRIPSTRDLSLYFHLPFCQSLCWYCGCTTVITTNQGASAIYLDHLNREVARMAALLKPDRKVAQLHFGGGTPTFLLADEIRALGKTIRSHFTFAENIEASAEIDPRRLVADHVSALREAGFNRASLGVQDFDPKVQQAIHRIQPKALTEQAINWMRGAGFESINIDLIYGLPYQTPDSFSKTLQEVIQLQPDRLAIFNYAHVPWLKPAQKILKALPSPEIKLELLKLTIEQLGAAGYIYIGMDHFPRADDELAIAQRNKTLQRNFQGYSTRGETDIYAFGMSSISQANGAYWQNHKELPDYYRAVNANHAPIAKGYILGEDDLIRREVIGRLMCDMSLDFQQMSRQLGLEFTTYFAEELASLDELEADGLIQRDQQGIIVTDLGRLLIRNIAVHFDAYHAKRNGHSFSKSI